MPQRKRFTRTGVLLTAVAVLVATPFRGQELSPGADAYLAERASTEGFSGVVLIDKKGEVLLKKGYGMADFELKSRMTPENVFRIASLTKTFTATGILLLYEKDRLSLQDPICRYISPCPAAWASVTIHQLLTHTSGIPDLFGELGQKPVKETAGAVEQLVRKIAEQSGSGAPEQPAGQVYSYSNFNYVLLGYILEKISGQYWEEFLAKHVFEPLGMSHTRYDDVWAVVEGRARGYKRKSALLKNTQYDDHSAYAAGGLRSTVDDLRTFYEAYFSGQILTPETLKKALQPYVGNYGYGWQVTEFFGRRVYDHTGGISGFATHVAYYPNEDLLIIVLSNIQSENAHGTACDLAALAFGADHVFLNARTVELPPQSLEAYSGEYIRQSDGATIRFSPTERGLLYTRGEITQDFSPVRDGVFVMAARHDVSLRFIKENGQVKRFIMRRCGSDIITGQRIAKSDLAP